MSELKRKTFTGIGQEEGQPKQKVPAPAVTNNNDKGAFSADKRGFAVEILPPKLWELIFQKLENPKDLLSCWNTTSSWATALQTADFYFKMALPFILPYLNRKDFLECSLVSKSWNSSVDACMQVAENFGSSSRLAQEQIIKLPFDSTRKMSDFIKRFNLFTNNESGENTVAINPVVFRRVFIAFDTQTDMEMSSKQPEQEGNNYTLSDLRRNLLKCLDHFGHLIRHFHLDMSLDTVNYFEKLKLLRSCLERMPNLRVVKIGDDVMHDGCNLELLEAFNVYISNNPWPALDHLKVLKFGQFTKLKRKALATITNAYGAQLLSLEFDHLDLLGAKLGIYGWFPCLQKLVHSCSESFNGFEFVVFLEQSQSPLKYLRLELPPATGNIERDLQTSVGLKLASDAVSDTLETLVVRPKLEVDNGLNFCLSNFDRMYLPRLKVLELVGCDYPFLGILEMVCPALQKLIILPYLQERSGSPIMRYITSCQIKQEGKMYANLYSKHDLWNELTELQSVDVKIVVDPKYGKLKGQQVMKSPGGTIRTVYTRHEYETKLKKGRQMQIKRQARKQSSTLKTKQTGCRLVKGQGSTNGK